MQDDARAMQDRQLDVPEAVGRIDSGLDRLYHQLDRMAEAARPVLAPEGPEAPGPLLATEPAPRAPLAHQLNGLADRVEEYADNLARLVNRMQV